MKTGNNFDVIIVGGSYAGLSAAMALGRSLRNVLIIDSGKPCNRQTPYSHNFITHDGETPKLIADKAREQVLKYDTIHFINGLAKTGRKTDTGFEIKTANEETFYAKKLLFATGVADQMPAIDGFSECWGISVIHCPYCHGYEVRNEKTGIMANGDLGYEFCKMISNWTSDLVLFTNGKSTLNAEQTANLKKHTIEIVESEIESLDHNSGQLKSIIFKDKSSYQLKALYAKIPLIQHCDIPVSLGCELTEQGHLKIDNFNQTNVNGIYAAGDNTTMMRAVSISTASGTNAGAFINKALIDENF